MRIVSPGLHGTNCQSVYIANHMKKVISYGQMQLTNLAAETAISMLGKTPGSDESLTDRSTRSHRRG